MTQQDKIPYIEYGAVGNITQESAEQIKTAEYWRDRYIASEKSFNALDALFGKTLDWEQKELKIYLEYKVMCERKIRFLSWTCIFMGWVIFLRFV